MPEYLSIRDAARRVGRSRRTIQRWLHDGLPASCRGDDPQKWIDLDDLQSMFVAKLRALPTRHPNPQRARHGNRSRYLAGCRCRACTGAAAAYQRGLYQARIRETAARRARESAAFIAPVVAP